MDVNDNDLQVASPQVMVDIDRDRAEALGVSAQDVQQVLFSAYGQRQVSVIYAPADQYSVVMEVEKQYQKTSAGLSKLYVRSSSGSLVPLETMVKLRQRVGPLSIAHFGQLPATTISFNLKPGYSLGQAAQQVDDAIPRTAHAAGDFDPVPRGR